MKQLMRKKSSMSGIEASSIVHLKNDLEELGSVDIVTYTSKFSLFFPYEGINESKPSDLGESNHVEIALNDAVVVQLFRGPWGFSGNFLDQNVSQSSKIEAILARNGYYTGEMTWRYAPWLPLFYLLGLAVWTLLAGIYIFDVLYLQNVSNSRLFLVCLSCACAAIFVYLYRRSFSS